MAAVEEKRRRQAVDLDTLMSKYGISTTPDKPIDVITVTDSPKPKVLASKLQKQTHPTPSKSTVKKKTPPKKPSSKSQKPIVKGPPTKRKKPSMPEESQASAKDSDSAYEPDSCLSSEDENPQSSKIKGKLPLVAVQQRKRPPLGNVLISLGVAQNQSWIRMGKKRNLSSIPTRSSSHCTTPSTLGRKYHIFL